MIWVFLDKLFGGKKGKGPKGQNIIPKTSQQTVPYIKANDDGIIELSKGRYSKTIKFKDINYQIARHEDKADIFAKYCDLLNYFNSNIDVQIYSFK